MLYVVSMWAAGLSQSLLWLSLDELGEVQYSFVEVMRAMAPYYLLRLLGGVLFLAGTVLMAVNLHAHVRGRADGDGVAAGPAAARRRA